MICKNKVIFRSTKGVEDKDGKSILHYSMLMPLDKDGRVRQGKIGEDGITWSFSIVNRDLYQIAVELYNQIRNSFHF
jgi:hypothetical protein